MHLQPMAMLALCASRSVNTCVLTHGFKAQCLMLILWWWATMPTAENQEDIALNTSAHKCSMMRQVWDTVSTVNCAYTFVQQALIFERVFNMNALDVALVQMYAMRS